MAEATRSQTSSSTANGANPLVSGLLSLIIPGLGHILHGQTQRGAVILGGSVVLGGMLLVFSILTLGLGALLFFFWPLVHIAAAADGYMQAGKINSGAITV